jgi:hypothetical protein
VLLFRHQNPKALVSERSHRTKLPQYSLQEPQIDLVVMEACGPSGWINDLASSHGLKTLVCSTNEDARSPPISDSYQGSIHPAKPTVKRELKEWLQSMKPKENSDHRKSRLCREARKAKAVADRPTKSVRTATAKR